MNDTSNLKILISAIDAMSNREVGAVQAAIDRRCSILDQESWFADLKRRKASEEANKETENDKS
jgi:hypothetical protein